MASGLTKEDIFLTASGSIELYKPRAVRALGSDTTPIRLGITIVGATPSRSLMVNSRPALPPTLPMATVSVCVAFGASVTSICVGSTVARGIHLASISKLASAVAPM